MEHMNKYVSEIIAPGAITNKPNIDNMNRNNMSLSWRHDTFESLSLLMIHPSIMPKNRSVKGLIAVIAG